MSLNTSLRLRTVHPLCDASGAAQVLYDLERTMIFAVPREWQREPIEPAHARSIGCEEWLIENDLLTISPRRSWSEPEDKPLPVLSDLSLDMSGACNMGCVYCFEKPINSRIGGMSEATALASLDFFAGRMRAHEK
jgi:sulfatase maturation enzyme AslB (radical SAM superfamily)